MEEAYKGYNYFEPVELCADIRGWSNLGTLVLFHWRYWLPSGAGLDRASFSCWDGIEGEIYRRYNPAVVLPVFSYDHLGFWISTHSDVGWYPYAWDGKRIGFIFNSRETVQKRSGRKCSTPKRRAHLECYLADDVATCLSYVSGEVWRYVIKDAARQTMRAHLPEIKALRTTRYLIETPGTSVSPKCVFCRYLYIYGGG